MIWQNEGFVKCAKDLSGLNGNKFQFIFNIGYVCNQCISKMTNRSYRIKMLAAKMELQT